MYRNYSVSFISINLNRKHSSANLTNVNQFQGNQGTVSRTGVCTNGQTEKETEALNIFQLCWNILYIYIYYNIYFICFK